MNALKRKDRMLSIVIFLFLSCVALCDAGAVEDQEKKAKSLAYYTMGVVYDLHGETEKAINEFERSAQMVDNYAVHLRMGADFARLGKLPEAVEELQRVLEYDKNNVQARYLLALIYSTQKKFDAAAAEYEAILKSFSKAEPENLEIYGYLAQLYYSQEDYDRAIGQFEIILSLDSDNTDIMFLLGSLYLERDNRTKAVEFFHRAIKFDSEDDISLNSLGYIYAEDGVKLDEAKDLIERAIAIDPENGAYLDSLGWVYFKKGEYNKALQYLHEADRYLKDPVVYEHIGDVYYTMDQKEEAKKYWKLSLGLVPTQELILKKLESLDISDSQ